MAPFMRKRPHVDDVRKAPDRRIPKREPGSGAADNTLMFGVLPIIEALRADARRIDRIVVAEGVRETRLHEMFDLARQKAIRLDRVPRATLEKLVDPSANHQGVVAFVAAADYVSVDEILGSAAPQLLVVLDGVEDPRNLGAVLRTVECAGG